MTRAAVHVWHFLRRMSIAETVEFLVCPVGNQQIEVLLAEGNLIDVATASRPGVGSLRSALEAVFNAVAASGTQCVLDFWASHDSQCSIVFHTASRSIALLSVALCRPRLSRRQLWPPSARPSIRSLV